MALSWADKGMPSILRHFEKHKLVTQIPYMPTFKVFSIAIHTKLFLSRNRQILLEQKVLQEKKKNFPHSIIFT